MWALNFMNQSINKRRFKKELRRLEADLGSALKIYGIDITDSEFIGKLDFWVSYYVTWLLFRTELPKEVWCDGSVWDTDKHILEFKKLSELEFSLECELDIQDDNSTYSGHLDMVFEYDSNFKKFTKYRARLSVMNNEYVFSSRSKL